MTLSINKFAIALALLISPLAQAATPVSQSKNGVTVTTQVMSTRECLDTFGKNIPRHMNGKYILPVSLSIQNTNDAAAIASPDWINAGSCCQEIIVLSLDLIKSMEVALTKATLAFESDLIASNKCDNNWSKRWIEASQLKQEILKLSPLVPLFQQFTSQNTECTIKPQETLTTYAFLLVEDETYTCNSDLENSIEIPLDIELASTNWDAPILVETHISFQA